MSRSQVLYLVTLVALFGGTAVLDVDVAWYWRLVPLAIALASALILGMALENAHPSPPERKVTP